MSRFPGGAWDLDDLDDVALWAGQLSRVVPKSFRSVISALAELSVRLADLCDPTQYDDPEDEPDPVDSKPATSVPPQEKIIVKSKGSVVPDDVLVNDPKVCRIFRFRRWRLPTFCN